MEDRAGSVEVVIINDNLLAGGVRAFCVSGTGYASAVCSNTNTNIKYY